MNVLDYIYYYGNYTFKDKPFNEIDNVIFSLLSYVDFNGILSKNKKNKLTINEAGKIYFLTHSKKTDKINILAIRRGIEVLNSVKDSRRFKDILMYNYSYIGTESSQFSAVTFDITDKVSYIAFEGTDQLISGWKEDLKMAYTFPVLAHEYAINYINKRFNFSTRKLIIGGHSKGGNLAQVAAMYSKSGIKRRILNVYSNDGQGLRKKELESKYYKSIENRFIHIIPQNSVVGLLLRHSGHYIIVKSNAGAVLSHDAVTWEVNHDRFKREKLSKFSKILDDGVTKWLDRYDDKKREIFVENIFSILEENNIKTLIEIKKHKNLIFKIIKSSKDLDPIVKEMFVELLKIINETNKEYYLF